ncbi:Tkl/drk protein kinase, partial [Globisporangium splendens]
MRPFEHTNNFQNATGLTYKKAALIAGGTGIVLWYMAAKRESRVVPSGKIDDNDLRPDTGTTQQVGTNRYQQQHRTPPPSKKTNEYPRNPDTDNCNPDKSCVRDFDIESPALTQKWSSVGTPFDEEEKKNQSVLRFTASSQVLAPEAPPSLMGSFDPLYLIPILVAAAVVLVGLGWFFLCHRRRRAFSSSSNTSGDRTRSRHRKLSTKRTDSALLPIVDPAALLSPGSRHWDDDRPTADALDTEETSEFCESSRLRSPDSGDGDELTLAQSNQLYNVLQNDPNLSAHRLAFEKIAFERMLSSRIGRSLCEVWFSQYEGEEIAVKVLRATRQATARKFDELQLLLMEIQVTASLEHPNIVRFLGVAWNSTTMESLCLINEYLSMGNLQDYLRRHNCGEDQGDGDWHHSKLQIALGIARAVYYLQTKQTRVPGLVSLRRVLRAKDVGLSHTLEAKLVDLGSHRSTYNSEQMAAGVGNAFWQAPEVLSGHPWTHAAEVYSFGVLLAEIASNGQLPFHDELNGAQQLKPFQILNLVAMGQLRPTFSPSLPTLVAELAAQCLSHDPADRISAGALVRQLERVYRSRS